jgi:streptogramin lyase
MRPALCGHTMASFRLLLGVSFLAAALAGCSPDERETGDDAPDAALAEPDASLFVDAAPLDDGGPPATVFTVYIHTKDKLYTLDPATLSPVLVGAFAAPGSDQITDLAVAPDGTIYVISQTKLYTADPTDGHVTLRSALNGTAQDNVGLTTLPDGALLATDEDGGVRRIDPATGNVTEIGAFGGGLATAGDLVATADGTMYAISDKGPEGDENTNNWLITVDTANGKGTKVGQIGFGRVFGAGFVDGKVLAFTASGQIVEIDPVTGEGTLKKSTALEFWGAGVSSLVPGVE